jgi:hypothetical protein
VGQETSSSTTSLARYGEASNDVSVVRGIRSLLITVVVAAVVSGVLLTTNRYQCYTETDLCVDLRMSASPVLYLGFAVIVFFALDRIINRNLDPFEAARVLDRARTVVMIVALGAIVIAQVWFWAIPVGDFGARGINVISPFLFGVIEVTTTTPAG